MLKKRKKHGYAERLKYMHMLEDGYSINYIHEHDGIDKLLLTWFLSIDTIFHSKETGVLRNG